MFDWIENLLVKLDAWVWRQRYSSRAQERVFENNVISGPTEGSRIVISPAKCGRDDVWKFPCG